MFLCKFNLCVCMLIKMKREGVNEEKNGFFFLGF